MTLLRQRKLPPPTTVMHQYYVEGVGTISVIFTPILGSNDPMISMSKADFIKLCGEDADIPTMGRA